MRAHRGTVEKAVVPTLGEIKPSAPTDQVIDGWLTEQKSGITTRKSAQQPPPSAVLVHILERSSLPGR